MLARCAIQFVEPVCVHSSLWLMIDPCCLPRKKMRALNVVRNSKVTYTLTFTDTYMHTQIHIHTYIYIYINIYIYIYIHMLSLLLCMPHEVIMYIDRKQPTLRSPIVIPFHSKL